MKYFKIWLRNPGQNILLTSFDLYNYNSLIKPTGTFDEKLDEGENSQFTLTFSMMGYIIDKDSENQVQLVKNYYVDLLPIGSYIELDYDSTLIGFIISDRTPKLYKNNVVYEYTAQDEVSYKWPKTNLGQSYYSERVETIFKIGETIIKDAGLDTKWRIADFSDQTGSITNNKIWLEVENSNPYNILIEACNAVGCKLIVNYTNHLIGFKSSLDTKFSGYRLRPEINLKDLQINETTDESCTILHVEGGTDENDSLVTLVPSMPLEIKNWFQKNNLIWNNTIDWDSFINEDLVQWQNNKWVKSDIGLYNRLITYNPCFVHTVRTINETEYSFDRKFFIEREINGNTFDFNRVEKGNYNPTDNTITPLDDTTQLGINLDEEIPKYSAYILNFTIYGPYSEPTVYFANKQGYRYGTEGVYTIIDTTKNLTYCSYYLKLDWNDLADSGPLKLGLKEWEGRKIKDMKISGSSWYIKKEILKEKPEINEWCLIANKVPHLGQFFYDFSYFKNKKLITNEDYKSLNNLFVNSMRINNTKLKLYTPLYYNITNSIVKKETEFETICQEYGAELQKKLNEKLEDFIDSCCNKTQYVPINHTITINKPDSINTGFKPSDGFNKLNTAITNSNIFDSLIKIKNKDQVDEYIQNFQQKSLDYDNSKFICIKDMSTVWHKFRIKIKEFYDYFDSEKYDCQLYFYNIDKKYHKLTWTLEIDSFGNQFIVTDMAETGNKGIIHLCVFPKNEMPNTWTYYYNACEESIYLQNNNKVLNDFDKMELEENVEFNSTKGQTYSYVSYQNKILYDRLQDYYNKNITYNNTSESIEELIKRCEDDNKFLWKVLYTYYYQYVYEQKYENQDELNSISLYNAAQTQFIQQNKPTKSHNISILDLSTLDKIGLPNLESGNKIKIYNEMLGLNDNSSTPLNTDENENDLIIETISRTLRNPDDTNITVKQVKTYSSILEKMIQSVSMK